MWHEAAVSAEGGQLSRQAWAWVAAGVAAAALAAALATALPVKYLLAGVACAVLLVIIYNDIQIGIVLFFVVNMTFPQAGPTWNLGMQMAVVGETRGLHFNIHEIIMTMVLVAWLARVIQKKAPWDRPSPLIAVTSLYVGANVLACLVGVMHGGSPLVAAFRFTRTVLFVYLLFVFINNVTNKRQILMLVVALLVCATLVAGFGIVQKGIGQTKTEYIAERFFPKIGYPTEVNYVAGGGEGQAYRVNSTLLHPNVLGAYLVLALPFFVSMLWVFRRGWQRLLLLAGLGVNLTCLFLTGSRAAWIGLGLIALTYCVLGILDGRTAIAIITILLVAALIFAMISPPDFVKKRFVSLSAKQAAKARMYQYGLAMDFFMAHPVLGLGMGMEGKRVNEMGIRTMWAAVENAFLTVLVSHGLVGLSTFVLLFVVAWLMLISARRRSRDDPLMRYTAEAIGLGLLGIATASMFGAWLLFAIPMVTLFWTMLGLTGSVYGIVSGESGQAVKASLAEGKEANDGQAA